MYLAYFDETGDDGYPNYSSELFVLTSVYMHKDSWHDNYQQLKKFRSALNKRFKFPTGLELHARPLLMNKNPFYNYGWTDAERLAVIKAYVKFISSKLNVKIINVVINKQTIINQDYPVLETALKYNVQRIENDMIKRDEKSKFILITDDGRIGKMRKVTRKVQAINFIPSHFGKSYRRDISRLVEDPLPKKSEECHFVQCADVISYLVYLYLRIQINDAKWPKRLNRVISYDDVLEMLTELKQIINLDASPNNDYGLVIYPKK